MQKTIDSATVRDNILPVHYRKGKNNTFRWTVVRTGGQILFTFLTSHLPPTLPMGKGRKISLLCASLPPTIKRCFAVPANSSGRLLVCNCNLKITAYFANARLLDILFLKQNFKY